MTRAEIAAEARKHIDAYLAGVLADSDARLIESVREGDLSLAVATATMEQIHAAAAAAIDDLVRQSVRILERLS